MLQRSVIMSCAARGMFVCFKIRLNAKCLLNLRSNTNSTSPPLSQTCVEFQQYVRRDNADGSSMTCTLDDLEVGENNPRTRTRTNIRFTPIHQIYPIQEQAENKSRTGERTGREQGREQVENRSENKGPIQSDSADSSDSERRREQGRE